MSWMTKSANVARWCAVVLLLSAVGCQARAGGPASRPPELPVYATPILVTPNDETPEEMFERARGWLLEGRTKEAAQLFDSLAQPHAQPEPIGATSALGSYAAFNAGIAWEQIGDFRTALARFSVALKNHPEGDVGKWAALRCARLHAALEEWSPLSAMADLLLARDDLDDVERLEAHGAKGLAIVESGDADGAEKYISRGRDIVEKLRLGEGGRLPIEVAELYFALGEVRRLRSLEQRCQGLLDAQSAYSDAMRSYDARWASMSGYRVGQLYQQLYKDVMAISPPKAADTSEKKRLFQGAMRLRYRVLLEKGLTMMEHTLMLGVRTGEASAWIDRARDAKRELEGSLREQQALIAKLPYSEKELELAIDDLAKKYR
jgi:tetratricopeptide (TPR) repeat protein